LLTQIKQVAVTEIRNLWEASMAAISATAPPIGDTLAQLVSGGAATPAATSTNSSSMSAPSSTDDSGPAAFVTLSEQAKAAAAQKAVSDQAAADQLQAFVAAHRVNGSGSQQADTQGASTQPASSSKVAVIVAQIKTLASANEPPPFQSFTPTKSISNSLTVDGFTLTLETNASTQFYGTELSGNGTQVYDKHFGPSDEAGGGTGAGAGVAISSEELDNNEALEAITVTRNVATANSVSTSSSAGSTSTSSVNAQSSSITFLVNYATGQISAEGTAASVSARSTSVGSAGSAFSTLA
jgi:hypothetical protein